LVPDVHAFPGHIACDSASNSEIVIPLLDGERLLGVMDIDSPVTGRFTQTDAEGLTALCRILTTQVSWKEGLL
ncbi:MAG: GAF domain-containing protein, partial [Aristaeellaceae bacterium]